MPIESIIRHCAPTLAGIKVGSLFSCRYDDLVSFVLEVVKHNGILNQKGVHIVLLKCDNGVALVYIYRKKQLEQKLEQKEAREFLMEMGYTNFTIQAALDLLRQHLQRSDFPHEIGVFLGYPLEDIRAFIEHGGANSKCTGYWKVYHNEEEAQKTFARYTRCTRVYFERYAIGFDIAQLTVAG